MSNKMSSIEACRIASMRELNDQLTQINSVLDIEKSYNGELIDMRKMFEVNYWCACPIDGMQKNQLELLKKELEELKKLVAEHVNRLVTQGATTQTQQT
ncbi:agamous-like MADS-box protein AGL62-like [Trifolium pratense]|uniref:Agamous-like MADS-box protein AGL62-like n=1 Tax=Trifolium pratense TaxID=57577 RepID=A0A2K3LQE6_TRIPR|nr:agamous-like MADS-box protein AGL62-like [Trifolium pratense]